MHVPSKNYLKTYFTQYEYNENDIHNILCDFANHKKNDVNCHFHRFSWLQQTFNNACFINYLVYGFVLKRKKDNGEIHKKTISIR